jgi:hypothetical protein
VGYVEVKAFTPLMRLPLEPQHVDIIRDLGD